jgi:hypothetical protein
MKLPGEGRDPFDVHFNDVSRRMGDAYWKSQDLRAQGYRSWSELAPEQKKEILDLHNIFNPEDRFWAITLDGNWESRRNPYRFTVSSWD